MSEPLSPFPNSSSTTESTNIAEMPALKWRIHPFRRDWRVSAAIVAVLLLVPIFTFSYVGSLGLGIFFLLIMIASLHRFFLSTEYQLDQNGISIKTIGGAQQRPWSQFRTVFPDKNGVLISPFAGPSRLENFRGTFLIFEKNRDEVIAIIRHYLSISGADTVRPVTKEKS